MEDKYFLNDILASEKNMVVNMAISLNEASCDNIYKLYHKMFEDASKEAADLFVIGFNRGWFTLDEIPSSKITTAYDKLCNEISNCN